MECSCILSLSWREEQSVRRSSGIKEGSVATAYALSQHLVLQQSRESGRAYEKFPIAMTDDEVIVSMLYKPCLPAQDKALIGIW